MKEVPLTQGKVALVDDEDFEYLNQWKWYAHHSRKCQTFYARRSGLDASTGKYTKTIHMHRVIMQCPDDVTIEVDHKNHNGLDNRRENLAVGTRQDNGLNRLVHKDIRYTGVTRSKISKSFIAQITINRRSIYLGSFPTQEEAAQAYQSAKKEYQQ